MLTSIIDFYSSTATSKRWVSQIEINDTPRQGINRKSEKGTTINKRKTKINKNRPASMLEKRRDDSNLNLELKLLKRKAYESYYKKKYLKTIILLESICWNEHTFKTLTLLGNAYEKSNSSSRISSIHRNLTGSSQPLDLFEKVDFDIFIKLLILKLASTGQNSSHESNTHHFEMSIDKFSYTNTQEIIHNIFRHKNDHRLQYYIFQRLQAIKSIAISNNERCMQQITYHKEGLAVLGNEVSTVIPAKSLLERYIDNKSEATISQCFIVLAKNASNYYHFIAECLPCYYIADQTLPESISFACQPVEQSENRHKDRHHDFHVQMLSSFFPKRKIQKIKMGSIVNIQNSYTTYSLPPMIYAKSIIDSMRKSLINSSDEKAFDVVYIKRGIGEGRELENESALLNLIQKYSQKPLILSTLSHSWCDQIEFIKGAKVIISSHGAQIVSSIFARKLNLIIEIWPKQILQPKGMCELFCDNYTWIQSKFVNKSNSGHWSKHALSEENIKNIEDKLLVNNLNQKIPAKQISQS